MKKKKRKRIPVHYSASFRGGRQFLEEQNSKLETLECYFGKLGDHKLPQMKVHALVTKPN